jgi:uncharacterized membrane protein
MLPIRRILDWIRRENLTSLMTLAIVVITVFFFALIFVFIGWSILMHPAPISRLTSTVPQTVLVGSVVFGIGICVLFWAEAEIFTRLLRYTRKWSTKR